MAQQRFKYQQIVSFINHALTQGSIHYGEKLPSLRSISRRFGCSLSVAIQAYQELEIDGLIAPVEKSGYFVRYQEKNALPTPEDAQFTLKPQETKLSGMVHRIVEMSTRRDILPLNCAIPDASIMPLAALKKSVQEVLRDNSFSLFSYQGAKGDPVLRTYLSQWLLKRGIAVAPEHMVVTNGCMEALAIAVEVATQEGGVIAVETPTFFGLLSLLETMKRKVVEIPCSAETGIDIDTLEKVLKKEKVEACIFTANYQNPLGFIMPESNKKALVRLAEEQDITLIEDDIYGECAFGETIPRPAKYYDTNGSMIYCSSVSKSLVPGYRIGWCLPGKFQQQYENIKLGKTLGNSPFLQSALTRFFVNGSFEFHLRRFRKKIHNQTMLVRNLVSKGFPQGTKISLPKGGYFLWVELPYKQDILPIFERALEEKIGFVPGMAFTTSERYKNCLRLSCGFPVDEKIEAGIKRLGELFDECTLPDKMDR